MTQLPKISKAIYKGLGGASSVLGQTYAIYRMTPTSTGSIIAPENIAIAKFNAYMTRDSSKKLIETQIFDLVSYALTGNATKLQVGDILVETGFAANGGRFCVAQIRYSNPFRVVAMKVETDVQIKFAKSDADNSDTPQTDLVVVDPDYGGTRRAAFQRLALENGQYSKVAPTGAAATIPIGIQLKDRIRDDHDPNLPTQLRKTQTLAYIPPLPGYTPRPLDVIYENPDREWTIAECRTNTTDLEGTVCILDTNAA